MRLATRPPREFPIGQRRPEHFVTRSESLIKNGRVLRMKPKEIRSQLNRRRNGARIVHGVQAHAKVAAKVRLRANQPETTASGALAETNSPAVADSALRAAGIGESAGFSELSLRRELERIHRTEVSPCVQDWADVYSQVGSRSRYLWKWATRGAELTTLPGVTPDWRMHVRDTKVLSIMICVLVDDVADAQKNHEFLNTLLNVVERPLNAGFNGLSGAERHYAVVTQELCNVYDRRIREYPYFEVYKDLLQYDQMQFLNTMRYSSLLNSHPSLLNLAEHEIYFPHNMHMMSFATLDLMCLPDFQVNELGRLREAVWHGQCMGRVGNLLSTWRREFLQGDFTSDVFARAVAEGDLSVEQLGTSDRREIEEAIRKGGHEEFFFRRWQYHKERFQVLAALVKSIDLRRSLKGHEQFYCMHLASRGLI